MRQLKIEDLEALSLGSAALGSGGGGDTTYPLLMAQYQFEKYGPIPLISVEALRESDLVVPLALMGAPLINIEKLPSGRELEKILKILEERFGRKPTVLMAGEIGGANAFIPLLIAGRMGLPVLDGDLIGRAFPELQMNSCTLKQYSATPAIMADALGNSVILETLSIQTLERLARSVTVAMGSSAAIALHIMTGLEAREAVVAGTLSQALEIGSVILESRLRGESPLHSLVQRASLFLCERGTVIDVQQEIRRGFLEGSVTLLHGREKIKLFYQNEYLLAVDTAGRALASTPDILMLIEETTGTPIACEALRYGLQVALMVLLAPKVWQTEAGLDLVGPQAFGYHVEYQPIRPLKERV